MWLLPFFCVISPRIEMCAIGVSRIDFRVEDIFIPLVLLLSFPFLRSKESESAALPVERAILLFLIAAEFSILNGMWLQTIDKPLLSFLYLLKWVQYFLVFWISVRLLTGEDAKVFLAGFFGLGLAVACYGYWEHFYPLSKAVYPNYYRLFERPPFHGDANHIGGLLVLWCGFFSGLYAYCKRRAWCLVLLASLLFVFFPLVWTYSRKSYLALAICLGAAWLLFARKRRYLLLILLLVIGGLFLPTRLSERLLDLPEALTSSDPFHSSWSGNLLMWKQALWNFEKFAFFGAGLGVRHRLYYESQYILILTETGLVGLTAFLSLCWMLIRQSLAGFNRRSDGLRTGVAAGWLTGFVGLLIHASTCVSLTVSKIAIPFWLLTGCVIVFLKERRGS